MHISSTVTAFLLLGLVAGPARAQGTNTKARPQPPPQVDVSKLPVDVSRLQRKLRQSVEREERNGSVLRYRIDVFGQAPPIQLITPETELVFTPPPYGAPTHRDMINIVTPKEFSSPVMSFGNLFDWFDKRNKNDK